jgi:hypothetical protein
MIVDSWKMHERFLFSQPPIPELLAAPQQIHFMPWLFFSRDKAARMCRSQLYPFSAGVNNAWSHTSVPPHRLLHVDTFTFTFFRHSFLKILDYFLPIICLTVGSTELGRML